MQRPRLEAIAYRMLGSNADAEDVVQEARLKLLKRDGTPDNEEAFLVRSVTNLCIDRLRRQQTERAAYEGPWLPELPATDWRHSPESTTELAEELSIGFMLLLDQLAPKERAAYVLRQAYDLPHAEIAELLGVTEAGARQHFRRARTALSAGHREQADATTQDRHRELIEKMLIAVASDDVEALAALFTSDAVALTDGGGVVSAARIPVVGAKRIAQVVTHLARKGASEEGFEYRLLAIAGSASLVILQAGQLHSVTQIDSIGDRVHRLYILRNPNKLERVSDWLDS